MSQRPGAPPGFVANILTVDSDGERLTNYSLALESPDGLVINDVVSGLGDIDTMPVSTALLGLFPEYEFDTYVQFGPNPASLTNSFGSVGHPQFGQPVVIDDSNFLVSAFSPASDNIGQIDIAQIVLGDQVNGDWFYSVFVSHGGTDRQFALGGIVNGVLQIPRRQVDATWQSPGDGDWDDPSNWSGGVPNSSGDRAFFSAAAPRGDATILLNCPITIGTLDVFNASTLTIVGPSELTLDVVGTG